LLERAAEIDPSNPVPLTYLALEYASRDIGRATALCERAWTFLGHPKLIGAQFLRLVVARCWAALRRKDADTAWATLSEWDAREGVDHPDVLTLRGLVAEAVGMTDHARAMFRAAVTPTEVQWTVRYISSDTAAERLRALGE
jgi:Tfp pilus assembly protein PilF